MQRAPLMLSGASDIFSFVELRSAAAVAAAATESVGQAWRTLRHSSPVYCKSAMHCHIILYYTMTFNARSTTDQWPA